MKSNKNYNHGGARPGAGRPKGQGPHGEATKPVRIPLSLLDDVQALIAGKGYKMPYYSSRIPAGLPSEPFGDVENHIRPVDMIPNPGSSFIVQVHGDSMIKAGIFDGDLLVVDESQEARHGQIVVASVNGEATVKRLENINGIIRLLPENDNHQPIDVPKGAEFRISGVVSRSLRRF
jgi:DNA polymerase V